MVHDPLGHVLVFCEVKTRASNRFGTALEAVTAAKQRRVRRLAACWLEQSDLRGGDRVARLRCDVAGVTVSAGGRWSVEVVIDAF